MKFRECLYEFTMINETSIGDVDTHDGNIFFWNDMYDTVKGQEKKAGLTAFRRNNA